MSDNEREHIVDPEAGVIGGEDDVPRQPAPPIDPYTPEPGPAPGEQRAFGVMRLAWVVLGVAALVLLLVYFILD